MREQVSNLFNDFVALLFPEYCLGCRELLARGENTICTDCRIHLPYTSSHMPSDNSNSEWLRRFYNKVPVKHALAYLYFARSGRVQQLLHELKYRGHEEIGEVLGNWFGADLKEKDYNQQFDLIIPVPLHRRKLQKRGYNQSDSFARGIAQALNIPWRADALQRLTDSATQTKKSRLERWENVEQIFKVTDVNLIQNQRLLVVDDVMTTGATLEACAVVLLAAGAQAVSVATIAAA